MTWPLFSHKLCKLTKVLQQKWLLQWLLHHLVGRQLITTETWASGWLFVYTTHSVSLPLPLVNLFPVFSSPKSSLSVLCLTHTHSPPSCSSCQDFLCILFDLPPPPLSSSPCWGSSPTLIEQLRDQWMMPSWTVSHRWSQGSFLFTCSYSGIFTYVCVCVCTKC